MKKLLIIALLLLCSGISVSAKSIGSAEYFLEISSSGSGVLRIPETASFQTISTQFPSDTSGAYQDVSGEYSVNMTVAVDYSKERIHHNPLLSATHNFAEYSKSTLTIPLTNEINATAALLAGDSKTYLETAGKLAEWVMLNIRTEPVPGNPNAQQILSMKSGQCREKTILLIALLRAQGIPARYVSGVLYSNQETILHAWAEAYIPGGGWTSFDPSQEQVLTLDGGHVKIWHSADPSDISPVSGQEYTLTLLSYELPYECHQASFPPKAEAKRGEHFTIQAQVENKCPGTVGVFRIISTPGISAENRRVIHLPQETAQLTVKAYAQTSASPEEHITILPGQTTARITLTGEQKPEPSAQVIISRTSTESLGKYLLVRIELENPSDATLSATTSFNYLNQRVTKHSEIPARQTQTVTQYFEIIGEPYTAVVEVYDQIQAQTIQINVPGIIPHETAYETTSIILLIISGLLIGGSLIIISPYALKGKKPFGGEF